MADDGLLALGPPATAPTEPYPGATASAQYFSNAAVERELQALVQRSLRRLLACNAGRRTYGMGSGGAFLPCSVSSVRIVVCLVKPREEDMLWMLVPSFCTFKADAEGVAKVNKALECNAKPDPKPYWGAKAKQITEMYSKFVPPNYVPDLFELAAHGTSGLVRDSVIGIMRSPEENAAAAAAKAKDAEARAAREVAGQGTADEAPPAASGKRKWCAATDDDRLTSLCLAFPGGEPQSSKQWKSVADGVFAGCEPSQCKSAWKKLKKAAVAGAAVPPAEEPRPADATPMVDEPIDETIDETVGAGSGDPTILEREREAAARAAVAAAAATATTAQTTAALPATEAATTAPAAPVATRGPAISPARSGSESEDGDDESNDGDDESIDGDAPVAAP
eukprot:5800520-Prymnesium_polylepis.1